MANLKTHLLEVEKNKFIGSIPYLEKEHNIQVLLAFVRGSHMYGTSTEKSLQDSFCIWSSRFLSRSYSTMVERSESLDE